MKSRVRVFGPQRERQWRRDCARFSGSRRETTGGAFVLSARIREREGGGSGFGALPREGWREEIG